MIHYKKKIDKIQRNTVMQEIGDNYIFVFFKLCGKQTAKWQKVEDKTLEEITEVAMRETWVWSPVWEDPLEKEMETHSSILTWKIPRTELI